jgi:Cytochrome P460
MRTVLKCVGVLGSCAALAASLAVVAGSVETSQDKYAVKVPGGLAFADFKGYESWQTVAISQDGGAIAVILANPVMIDAYRAGVPDNGKPFPEGSKMAKVHWKPVTSKTFPAATVPGTLQNVDFMQKDSKRFADSGGWGWAVFEYDEASGKFRPGDDKSTPPQAHDAKCGLACHTLVKTRDFVFTEYARR